MAGVVDGIVRQITRLTSQTENLNERVRDLETGLEDLTFEVEDIVISGGGATVDDVLEEIQSQGFLDISDRWSIGEEPGFGTSFVILDKLSRTNGGENYYEFLAGEGDQVFPF